MNLIRQLKRKIEELTTRYDVVDAYEPTEKEVRRYLPEEDLR
jgi:hypothetical protein